MPLIESLALIALQPSAPATVDAAQSSPAATDAKEVDEIGQAYEIIKAGKPADAMRILDALIARFEKQYANEKRQIFSSRSLGESLIYTSLSQKIGKDVLVLKEDWATAYFLKGYVLIDMKRFEEAKPQLDRAIALAPMNAQFLSERGEWYKSRKDWLKAYANFESASTAADFSPEDIKDHDKARALRGMGFVKIEMNELQEAKKLFRQSLKLEPDNSVAKSELQYIESLERS